jgi:hypothetical protein
LLNDVPFYSGGGPCFELKAVYYKMYTHLFKKDNPSLPGEEIPGSFDSETIQSNAADLQEILDEVGIGNHVHINIAEQ